MELEVMPTKPEWAANVIQYLKNGLLLEDKVVAQYSLLGGVLYKKGYFKPLLKCLAKDEAEYKRDP
jgi:hypothetical protein